MTSPAIRLAKECNVKWHSHISTAVTVYEFYPNELETFYAKAQAQALRNAADDYHKDCDCTDYLRRMAGDLEAGK